MMLMAVMLLPFASQAQDVYNFEDGQIPAGWSNTSSYPWTVVSSSEGNGHTGTYCMKSGNSGISSSTSSISATFTFLTEGSISFLGGIYGEGTSWDVCKFSIDGTQQFAYGDRDTWETYTFPVTAGQHTFTWAYTKDGSVNPTGDAFFVDDVEIEGLYIPDCYPVRNLAFVDSLTTSTGFTFTWSDTNNSAASYNVYLISGTDTNLLANVGSDTIFTIDTLQGNTPYTFGVEADCGGDGPARIVTINGRTACVAVTEFPWEENFETYAAGNLNIPCWLNEHISGNGTSVFKVYTSTNGGNTTHQLQLPDMTSGTRTLLRLPFMDFDGEEYLLSIDVYRNTSGTSYTSEGVRVFASTDGEIQGATELGFLYRNCNQTDNRYVTAETATGWYTYEIPIPFTTTGYIILRGESSYGSSTYMDNLKVVRNLPCKKVMHLAVIDSMTTAESLTLNWLDTLNDGNTYKVYTITPTDSAGVFDTVLAGSDITDTFYTVQNLTPNTDYIFMVVADCGGDGESNGVFVSGHTGCVPLDELPYTMSFEADDLMGTTTMELFPWCWTRINTLTSGTTNYFPYSIESNPYNGSRALYFYAYSGSTYADTTGFILPELDVTTYPMNANRLAFWAKVTSTTPYRCIVVTMEDPADRSTYTVIDTVTVNNTTYTKYSVPLSEANSTDPYVAVIVPRVNAVMYIDDVTLEEMPACLEVTDLAVVDSLTTANTVTLVWRDTLNSGASYSVYVITPTDSAGIFDTTLVGSNISDTTFMVENLTGNRLYTFAVQTNCGGDDAQMIRVSTRTACIVEPIPFSENFSEALVSCWNGANAQASQVFAGTPLTMGAPSTGWTYTTSNNGINGGHYYKNIYGSSVSHWLITPSIDLAEVESAVLHFDMALTAYSGANAPATYTGGQRFMVIVSTDNGQTWSASNATVWNQDGTNADYAFANVPWQEYATYVVNLNQYLGDTIRIAFYGESLSSGGDNNLHLDNIIITEAGAPMVSLPATTAASIGSPFELAATLLDGVQPVTYTWTSARDAAGDATMVASDSIATLTYNTACVDTVKVVASNAMGVDSAISIVTVTCLSPSNLQIICGEEDTVARWTGVASLYEYAVLTGTESINTAELITTQDDSVVLEGIENGVTYTLYVRAVCGDAHGAWVTKSFTPGIYILAANATDTLRSCGAVVYDDGGPNGNYANNQTSKLVLLPTSPDKWLVISGTSHTEGSWDYTTIYDGVGTTGTVLFKDNTSSDNTMHSFGPFMLPSATLVFYADGSNVYAGFELNVSCIDAPSCFPPVSIAMESHTSDSLELSWNDTAHVGNYWVEYRAAGDTGEWTGFAVTDTAAIIADLSPNTLYDIRVVTVCSSSDSSIAAEASFRTACGILTDADMPFFESFESYATGSTAAFPDCWNRLNLTTSSTNYPYVNGSYHHGTGGKCMYAYVYDSARAAYLILPEISDVNTKNIDFWVARGNSYATVTIGVMDDPTSAATFVPIQTIVPNTTSTSNWVEYDVNLNSYTGAGTYIAMRFNTTGTSSQYGIYVDEITVSMIPDCPRPYVTVVDSITTAHTATLVWESAAGNFRVEYKKTTDSIWSSESVTDTAVVLTGLDANTAYVARVIAFCGNDSSEYSRDVNFTTTVSCPAPGTPRAILTPGDGTVATIVWSDPTASAWQICLNGDTNNYIDVTDSATFTFNTLTPEQPYTLKVRRDCTDEQEGYSTWSSTITFVPTDAYSLIVNDGTNTNSYVPIYGMYVDENIHSRFIIPAADLAQIQFGVINKLVFHASNTSVTWSGASFQVYMTETDATTVSSVVPTTDMEQVYSGSLSIANNKMEVDFTTPYQYMGGNLMIAFEEPTTGSWSSCSWYGVNATGASMGGYGSSVSQQNFLPKTTIYFIPGSEPTCFPVSDLQVVEAMTTDESITVTWEDTVNSAATYDVYIINGNDTLAYTSNTTSYTFENLQASTAYTIVVAANCGSDVAMIRSVNARTGCAGGGCTITIVGTDDYGDGWNGGYIDIIQDGSSVGQYSNADSGYEETPYTDSASIVVCSGSPVTFVWHSGNYVDEVSFVIKNANDSVLYTISDATSLTDGAVFYTATDPCAGAPIVEPDTFYVTLSSADTTMGTVSPAGVTAVLDGHIFTANATPATNYVFTGWVNAAGDTVSTANPYTFTVTADITLIGTFAYSVGIESASLDNVNLFPNPASTSVTINGLEAKASVTLVDINGHVSGQWKAEGNTLTIDLTNYATGTYFVRIVGEKAVAVRKLIVK